MAGFGYTTVVRDDTAALIAQTRRRVQALYEKARAQGEQSLQALVPRDTGALADSSHAEPMNAGLPRARDAAGRFTNQEIGFTMRSFGNEATGQMYARWVNEGHHTRSGSWVPPNPFFSQSVADAKAVIAEGLATIFAK
jgi:hypothetical protein